MGELPKQLLAWLARLLPKQTVHGDDAVQVGQVGGSVQVNRNTHNSAVRCDGAVQVVGQVGGGVHVTHITTHQHIYGPGAANDTHMTQEQREVLAQMKKLNRRAYNQVVAFMRREVDTGLVNQLNSQQLYRVQRYVQTIQRNAERERA